MGFSFLGKKNKHQPLQEPTPIVKILLLGQPGCGKSSIRMRFIEDQFQETIKSTAVGVEIVGKEIQDKQIFIYDPATNDHSLPLLSTYLNLLNNPTDIICFCYDITSESSFLWFDKILNNSELNSALQNKNVMLLGCKADLIQVPNDRKVSMDVIQKFAQHVNALTTDECSAKTMNVKRMEDIFTPLATQLLEPESPSRCCVIL